MSASYDTTSNGEQHDQNADVRRSSSTFFLAGCGPDFEDLPAQARVNDATVTGDGTQVAFGIDLCARPLLEFTVEETPDEVRVEAVTEPGPDPDDCAMQEKVTLDEPLGDRAVIDVGTGEPITQILDGTDEGASDQEPEVEATADDTVDPVGSGGIPPAEQWPVTAILLACGTCESAFDIGGIVFEGSCLPVREELVGAVIADQGVEVAELVGEPNHLRVAWRDTDMPCDEPQDVWRLGRVISPSANLVALSVDADGVQLFPTVPPSSKDAADNAEWHQNLDDWFERFNRIDVFTARNITLPDLQGAVRVASPGKSPGRKINCCATCGPHRNDLPTAPTPPGIPPPACTCASTTIRRDNHPMRTWQPFPYGTRAWAHLYFGGRDRIEGVVADVRETMHLKGGRNECRIRGIAPSACSPPSSA